MTIASKDNLHTARDTELQNSATPPPQFCNIKICDISANLSALTLTATPITALVFLFQKLHFAFVRQANRRAEFDRNSSISFQYLYRKLKEPLSIDIRQKGG